MPTSNVKGIAGQATNYSEGLSEASRRSTGLLRGDAPGCPPPFTSPSPSVFPACSKSKTREKPM